MKNRARLSRRWFQLRHLLAGATVLALALLLALQPLSAGVSDAAGTVYTSPLTLRAGTVISDCTIQVPDGDYAISGSGASGAVIRNVTVNGSYDALKVGSGAQTVGLTVDGLQGIGPSHVAVFLANVTNGEFDKLVMDTSGYALYLERGNHGLTFRDIDLTSSDVWTVHAYNYETQNEPSDGLLMDGGTVSASRGAFVLSGGWNGITIRNLEVSSSSSSWPIFRLYGGVRNVVIENLEVWGGSALLDVSHPESAPVNITLRNIVYHGTTIATSATRSAIQGLTLENVTLAGAQVTTTTTQAPTTTTTTTQAPTTTTTTQAPTTTTTTTQAPTTTTTTTQAPTTTTTTQAPTTTTTTQAPTTTTTTTQAPTTTTTTQAPTTTTTTQAPTTTTTTQAPTTTTTTQAPTTTTTTPPTGDIGILAITSPADQSMVWGKVAVRVSVASPVRVAKVRLYVDDRVLSQDYRYPYAFSWNTRSLAPGTSHTLKGIAYDPSGRRIAQGTRIVSVGDILALTRTELSVAGSGIGAFADLGVGSLYEEAIATLAEAGVVSGYTDGTFGAGRPVTRSQMAKMVALSLGLADENTSRTPFGDLGDPDGSLYPHKFIAALSSIGAVSGTSATEFSPYTQVTRAQLVAILVRALETLDPQALSTPAPGLFSAVGDTGYADFTGAMAIAEANSLFSGIIDYGAKWDPWAAASRGELAQILNNLASLD